MEKRQIRETINKALVLLLTFTFGLFYAKPPVPGNGGAGGVGPGQRERVPVDMYETILLGVAVLMIIGYYLYSKNRKVVNS